MSQPAERGAWSWDLPTESAPNPRRSLPPADDFRRTVIFTIVGTIVPGLGLIVGRRRIVGSVILGIFAATVLSLGIFALVDRQGLLAYAVNPVVLRRVGAALIAIAVLWVGVVVATHLALRGRTSSAQRATGGILVGLLAFVVAAPMAVAANYSYVSADAVSSTFRSQTQSKSATRPTFGAPPTASNGDPAPKLDPWADKPRLNVLLLGGDAGPGREGTRTDTVILASIDTSTGDTTLFSLPRNTGRMPFPDDSPLDRYYPNGFTNGDGNNAEFFLNAMYDKVPTNVPNDALGPTDNLGADALKLSVGTALGLQVDYYALINLQGFAKMINALGGITVNVNTYIPMGGNTDLHIPPKEYLEPGAQRHLDGREALWYARGRYGSDDFARMDRQRCVINAIIKQANPTNLLSRYEDIAKAGKAIIKTDVPQEVLPLMVDLALRAKDGNVRSIVFKHGVKGFLSPNPDYSSMRKQVKTAIGEAKSDPPAKKKKKEEEEEEEEANPTTAPKAASDDVNDTCAFDAKTAATAQPYR